jgi:hypothetical protein
LEQVGPPDLVFYRRPRTNPKEKSSTRPDALDVLSRLSTRPDPAVSIIYWRMSVPPIGSSRVTSQGISLLFILGRNFWFNVNVVDVRGYSGNSSFVKCHRTESVMDVLRIDLLAFGHDRIHQDMDKRSVFTNKMQIVGLVRWVLACNGHNR